MPSLSRHWLQQARRQYLGDRMDTWGGHAATGTSAHLQQAGAADAQLGEVQEQAIGAVAAARQRAQRLRRVCRPLFVDARFERSG